MRRALWLVAAWLCCAAMNADAPVRIRAEIWTEHTPNLAHLLVTAPGECLASHETKVEIGRALFRASVLFNGPAARIGLSCQSCHQNGHANPHFFLPELTDTPGAVDVTSEWASKTRGDGIMNPRPIPDLVDVASHAPYGRLQVAHLDDFVHGVIEDEFQGPAPPPQAFDSVIAYINALNANACPSAGDTPITLASAASDVSRALDAARGAEPQTARLVILAAQDNLALIAERLPSNNFATERAELDRLARDLGLLRDSADIAASLSGALPGWQARFDALIFRIAPRESETYFNADTLARALH